MASNINLKSDGERIYWDGTLCKLKQFVSEELNLSGTWKSPGGEVKQFISCSLSLKWQGKTKKWIIVSGEPTETNSLIELLTSLCNNTAGNLIQNDTIDEPSTLKSSMVSSREETGCLTAQTVEESEEQNKSVIYEESNSILSAASIGTESASVFGDLTRLIDKRFKETPANTISADSIKILEIKLELAMLWATVNSLQEKSIQSQGKPPATQDQIPCTRSIGTQTTAEEDQTVKQPGENPPTSRDFVNQLKSYKATQRDKFESLKPRHDERKTRKATKPKNSHHEQGKNRKSMKPKIPIQAENNKINELERTIKNMEQENESLKTIMQIQKDEFNQALSVKEDNENHRPWQIFKPKQTINLKDKQDKRKHKWQSQNPIHITTSNQYESLESKEIQEIVTETDKPTNVENMVKPKNNAENSKSTHPPKKHGCTVLIGDSLLKGLRQHSISKAVKTKTTVKCFPGAKVNDLNHYCIPVLATKPKHAIIHCGTNDLRTKDPQEITKQMGALCDFIVEKCPDIRITVSSLITRNDDQDKKVTEVNTQLQSLCLQKDLSFLLHDNLDKKCLNQSGLHLNKFGDSILAKNFIETIKRF